MKISRVLVVLAMLALFASVAMAAPSYINEARQSLTAQMVSADARFAALAVQFGRSGSDLTNGQSCNLPVGSSGKFRWGCSTFDAAAWPATTAEESAVMPGVLYDLGNGWFLHAQLGSGGNAMMFYGQLLLPQRGEPGPPGKDGAEGKCVTVTTPPCKQAPTTGESVQASCQAAPQRCPDREVYYTLPVMPDGQVFPALQSAPVAQTLTLTPGTPGILPGLIGAGFGYLLAPKQGNTQYIFSANATGGNSSATGGNGFGYGAAAAAASSSAAGVAATPTSAVGAGTSGSGSSASGPGGTSGTQ